MSSTKASKRGKWKKSGRILARRRQVEKKSRGSEKTRRRLEEGFSSNFLQRILDNVRDFVIVKDRDLKYVLVNKAFCEFHGESKGEVIGKTVYDTHPKEEADPRTERDLEVLEKGSATVAEYPHTGKGGVTRMFESIKVPLKDDGGNVTHIVTIARDITERKLMEEELGKSELEKTAILDSMLEQVIYQDTEHRVLWVNRISSELAGLPREQMVGRRCYELWHQRNEPCVGCPVAKAVETGQPQQAEITTPDGKIWFIQGNPIRDAKGNVTKIVEVVLDITELKRFEKELSFKDVLLEAQFETSIDGILVVDRKGEITLSNKRFGEIWSIPREILDTRSEEKTLQSVIGQLKDPEMFLGKIKYLREYSKEKSRDEIEFKDGRLFAAYSSPLVDSGDKHHGRIWYFRDITHIKRAEQALRESEEKYRVLVEQSPNLVAILQDGVWKYVNRAMCERLGWTYEELTSSSFNHVEKTVPERFQANVKEYSAKRLRGEPVPQYESALKTKDNLEIPVMVRGERILYHGKPATEMIFIDITERKRMEEERLRVMGEVAMGIGHDLRNPLHAIRVATHILRDAPEEKRLELLELIDRDIVYADRIVRNLIDFAYLQPPKLSMEDVNSLLQEVLTQIVLPKNVRLVTSYDDMPKVKLDRDQLNRAFTNLILNAVQAIPESGAGILDISTGKTGNFVEIKIMDTGVGIPKEKFEKIFDPFFTTKAKGIGLGLPTAKSIVEAHRGTIKVESEEGRGTTVTVQLPIS